MSEEFDKEAEREKLREKLEKDERKREETQRMSELLLQGATMTNEHCGNCGDPLFRDGGETFCPTCGGARAEANGEGAAEATAQPQQATNGQQAAEQPGQQTDEPTDDTQSTGTTRERTTPAEQSEYVDVSGRERRAPADEQPTRQRTPDSSASGDTDPRAELQRAVTRAARQANEATDPRTAKQWLEAAKEAAAALEALGK